VYGDGDTAVAYRLPPQVSLTRAEQCKTYKEQAAGFVFRARCAADEIDLRGLYGAARTEGKMVVMLRRRRTIFRSKYMSVSQRREDRLHVYLSLCAYSDAVIVGKGIPLAESFAQVT
jgi:hypothetical protein